MFNCYIYPEQSYITALECLRRNAYRHYLNGMKYLERGMTQHARGSFAKAQRNYDRANMLTIEDYICAPMLDWFSKKIAESILNG